MAGAWDFLPPFSFWAAIISCLLLCKSFSFLLFSLLLAELLLFCSLLLSKFFLLQPLEFLLFLCSFIPPLVDVLLQLIIQLALL